MSAADDPAWIEYNRWRVAEWRRLNPEKARESNRLNQARWRLENREVHLSRMRDRTRRRRAKLRAAQVTS